jgi:hypothetical protein
MFEEYEEGFNPSFIFEDKTPIPGLVNNLDLYNIDELSDILKDPSFKAFAELYPEQAETLQTIAGVSSSEPARVTITSRSLGTQAETAGTNKGPNVLGNLDQSVEAETAGTNKGPNVLGNLDKSVEAETAGTNKGPNVLGNLDQSVEAETAGTNKGPNVLGNLDKSVEAETAGTNTGTQPTGLAKLLQQLQDAIKNITGFEASDVLKTAFLGALAKFAYDDAREAREAAKGTIVKPGEIPIMQAVRGSDGGVGFRPAAEGGLMSVVGMVDPIRTAQRIMTDPQVQQRFEGYLIDELQQQGYAEGGVARYFAGGTDGMADQIPAQIENQRPAALSDGEFVIPADVVSHLGNGNSTAGARRLYEMMDRIREARTGTTKQSRQIDANDFTLG